MAGTLPSGTSYPGSIDGLPGYAQVVAGEVISATFVNNQTSAILALENVIGATPTHGTPYATVGAAIQGLSSTGGSGGIGGALFLAQSFT